MIGLPEKLNSVAARATNRNMLRSTLTDCLLQKLREKSFPHILFEKLISGQTSDCFGLP